MIGTSLFATVGLVHVLQALLLWFATFPARPTSITMLENITGGHAAVVLLFVAGSAAMVQHKMVKALRWRTILLLPQQFVLIVSAWGAFWVTWTVTYPNNYTPPEGWIYMALDQSIWPALCIGHLIAMFQGKWFEG